MRRRLRAIGNSLGIIIEKPILELLDINKDTELEITTDGKGLVIRPVRQDHEGRVAAAIQRVMNAHDDTFHKLAE